MLREYLTTASPKQVYELAKTLQAKLPRGVIQMDYPKESWVKPMGGADSASKDTKDYSKGISFSIQKRANLFEDRGMVVTVDRWNGTISNLTLSYRDAEDWGFVKDVWEMFEEHFKQAGWKLTLIRTAPIEGFQMKNSDPTIFDEWVPAQPAYVEKVVSDYLTLNRRVPFGMEGDDRDYWLINIEQKGVTDVNIANVSGVYISIGARAFWQESERDFRADVHPVTVGHVEILPQTPEKSRVVIVCKWQSDAGFTRLFEKLGGYILERTDSKERSLKWRMQQLGARLPKEYHTPTESSAPTEQPTWRGNGEPPKTRAEKIKAIQAWDAIPRDERPPLADWLIENFGTDPATENQNVIESTFHSWRRLKNS